MPWRDGSTRYRCYHIAEALHKLGHIADVCSMNEVRLDRLERYNVVSVLRPHLSKALDQLLKQCRRLGILTIADVDDLIFVPKYSSQSPSVINNQATEFSIRSQFRRNLRAMLSFDEISVSTEPLAEHWLQESGIDNVTVVPNGLSRRWLNTPVKRMDSVGLEKKTITYLPGSNSHNKDFAEITNILCDTLKSYKDVKLLIIGSLQLDERMFPANQLIRSRWVDYFKLPQIITDSTVTLAPLVPSPFTNAKSHIKYIESAAFGTPAICSPNHDICRHNSSSLHIAETGEDWNKALETCLNGSQDRLEYDAIEQHIKDNESAEISASVLLTLYSRFGDTDIKCAVVK